jgi:hypothetical protein
MGRKRPCCPNLLLNFYLSPRLAERNPENGEGITRVESSRQIWSAAGGDSKYRRTHMAGGFCSSAHCKLWSRYILEIDIRLFGERRNPPK